MFGHQYLILNLFSWLTFLFPHNEIEVCAMPQSSYEVIITTGQKSSPAIIEMGSYLNEIIDSSQNNKLPLSRPFETVQSKTVTHEPKLLYFQIGNAIELELTSTAIIFPFHCFT